jgi:DNA-binding Xre family transcriptional regulator
MFKLRIKETMKQMGVKPTISKLTFLGSKYSTAYNLMNGKAKSIKLKTLFDICIYLNCTPNDLLDIADKDMNLIPKGHPLLKLKKPDYIHSPISTLRDLPYDKINEANELLNKLKEK